MQRSSFKSWQKSRDRQIQRINSTEYLLTQSEEATGESSRKDPWQDSHYGDKYNEMCSDKFLKNYFREFRNI